MVMKAGDLVSLSFGQLLVSHGVPLCFFGEKKRTRTGSWPLLSYAPWVLQLLSEFAPLSPSTLLILRKAPRLLNSALAPSLQAISPRTLRQLLPRIMPIYQAAVKSPERLRLLRRHSQLHSLALLQHHWKSEDRHRQLLVFYREQRMGRMSRQTHKR